MTQNSFRIYISRPRTRTGSEEIPFGRFQSLLSSRHQYFARAEGIPETTGNAKPPFPLDVRNNEVSAHDKIHISSHVSGCNIPALERDGRLHLLSDTPFSLLVPEPILNDLLCHRGAVIRSETPIIDIMAYLRHERAPTREVPAALRLPDPKPEDFHSGPLPAGAADIDEQEAGAILCGSCRVRVTDFESVIEMNGKHDHTFINPAGVVFHIGCFSTAEGCRVQGIPTVEYTWFPGYAWSFATCGNCGAHLGWHYESRSGEFYGLILLRLIWAGRE